MAKMTKTIPMPSTDRDSKAGKAGPALGLAEVKSGTTSRVKIKEATEVPPKEEIEPDPLLIYMAKAVLKRRKEMGLTQLQLSQKAGCNSTAIFMVEGAKHNMTIRSVMLLAAALDLQVSDFFPRSTPRNAAKMAEVSEVLTDMAGRFAIQVRSLERLAVEMKEDAQQ
jgi:transcriptional regulator with XRE-family HTH domain